MKNRFILLIAFGFLLLSSPLAAKPLPPEIVQPIHIMDLIIKGNDYDFSKCGDYICEIVSSDSSAYLKLTRTTLRESRATDVDFRLEIRLKGGIVASELVLEYLHDPNKIRFISSADGTYYPDKGEDPVVYKVLDGWLDWMLKER